MAGGKTRKRKMSQEDIIELEELSYKQREELKEFQTFTFRKEIVLKTEKQKDLMKAIHENDIIFVSGAAGVGKAQPLDAKILTPNGFVTMGSLKSGDMVISKDGTPTEVIGIFPQGKKEIYRVIFNDKTWTECCKEHLWLTQTDYDRNFRKKEKGNIYHSPKQGTVKSLEEINNTLMNKNRTNHSIPMVSPVNFIYNDILIDPYVLGVILGDGCLRGSKISISSKDEKLIENCLENINSNLKIDKINSSKYEYCLKSTTKGDKNEYIQYLKELNLFGLKSDQKFIPNIYLINTTETRISLLQGLMDTDGYVDKTGMRIQFSTVSRQLAEGVKFIVESLGGNIFWHEKIKTFKHKGIKKEGKLCYELTLKMPSNINPFKISRKKDLVKPKTKYSPIRYIKNIEYIGEKEAQCIMVNHNSSLYVTDNFIVTHNTFVALKGALELLKDPNNPIEKIIVSKPIVEAGENIGFLPGTLDEKIAPYLKSYEGNLKQLIGAESARTLLAFKTIEAMPLAYLRGDTFRNSVAILDEAQNTTVLGLKLFLSRIGENSKIIIMGDIDQTDLQFKKGEKSGLEDAFERFKNVKRVAFVQFSEDDIVRHSILIDLMKCYNKKN